MTDQRARATIDSKEFYDLCQTYRHTPVSNQTATCAAFSELIIYIDKALADERRRVWEEAAVLCEAEALIDDERGYYGKEMAKAIRAKATE